MKQIIYIKEIALSFVFLFTICQQNFSQSVSLTTDRGRVTIASITDPFNANGPKLKVLRTDANTPLRAGTSWVWSKGTENPESYYASLANYGLNAVRVILFDTWEYETYPPSGSFTPTDWNDPAYRTAQLARMERAVNWASAHGLYAILNSHNHVGMYAENYTSALWTYVAPYFANRTHVLYELANEPMSGIGNNGNMEMAAAGTAGALTSPKLKALARTYNVARPFAPNTMFLILSPTGVSDYGIGTGLGNVADAFKTLANQSATGKFDANLTGVAFHLYHDDGGASSGYNAGNIRNLLSRYAGWASENNFAPGVSSASLNISDDFRSQSFSTQYGTDAYVSQTCERLGMGWSMWNMEGQKLLDHNWPVYWADAVAKGWSWAKDVIIESVTARGENLPNEGVTKLYDNNLTTKWLDVSPTSWIQFAFPTSQKWNTYKITSGNLAANKTNDPKNWTMLASNDNINWTTLDTQTDQSFAVRSTAYSYSFTNEVAYKYYKLDITVNNGGTSVELGELQYSYLDKLAPSVPAGLKFSSSNVLTWTASTDNVGVAGYEIFNNGISIGNSLTNSYNLTNPSPNTAYNFKVKANDAQGNWSELSSVLSVTTGNFINLEAENATLNGGGLNTNHPGYSGTGFWDNVGTVGNSVEFTVNSVSGGNTDIKCRYSSGGEVKTMTLYVNGIKIRTLSFPPTANWDSWGDKTDIVTLNAGSNKIKYQYDSGNTGYINVDYIQVTDNTSGIAPQKNDDLKIFPNPATKQITIENAPMNSDISIFSIDGRLVHQQKLSNTNAVKIDVSKFEKGAYLIAVQSQKDKTMKEIIVQ